MGIAGLIVGLLFIAEALGLIPDRDGAVIAGRKSLCESVAIGASLAVMNEDVKAVEVALRAVAARNRDILSAGVRGTDGQLKVSVGKHEQQWGGYQAATSTATHMHLPIAVGNRAWGRIELCFRPVTGSWVADKLGGSVVPLIVFLALAGSGATYMFLRSVLRKADVGKARVVPQRVRDTLNTVMEGVLVLDKQQRIALANDSFARMIGTDPAALRGVRASDLEWAWRGGSAENREQPPPWARSLDEGTPQRGAVLDLLSSAAGPRVL
jgi:PAS domain-containing protein